jgi:nucleoside triphosphatase
MAEQVFPEPCAGALIFNPDGKLFLMKSHKWHDRFVVPGGHVELGETIEQALKREILEETGFEIFDIKFVCFREFIFGKAFWKKRHFIFFDFACRTTASKPKLNSEAETFAWALIGDAQKLPLEPYTRQLIATFLEKFPDGF